MSLRGAAEVRVRRSVNPACALTLHRWHRWTSSERKWFAGLDEMDYEDVKRTVLILCDVCGRTPQEAVDAEIVRGVPTGATTR